MTQDDSHSRCCSRLASAPRNVKVLCVFAVLFHAGWSIWERNIFPVYLQRVSNSSLLVGTVQSAQGITALVAAPLLGTVMDKGSWRAVQGIAVLVGGVAIGLVAAVIWLEEHGVFCYAALCAWGLLLSAQGILVETTLANSVASGRDRRWAFAIKSSFWRLGNALGQALNLSLFLPLGNAWDVRSLQIVQSVGLAVLIPPVVLLLVGLVPPARAATLPDKGQSTAPREPREIRRCPRACARWLRPPWVITASVILRVFGKGIIMRFNPILFEQVYGVGPVTLTAVTLAAQIISVAAPIACTLIADRIGPALTIVAVRLVEPAALLGMAFSPRNNAYPALASFALLLGVPVGCRSVEKALLNDYTAPKSRGRWNALETLNRGTWAGSAALGGYLVEDQSFGTAYATAAGLTGGAVVVMTLLIAMIPHGEGSEEVEKGEDEEQGQGQEQESQQPGGHEENCQGRGPGEVVEQRQRQQHSADATTSTLVEPLLGSGTAS